MEKGAPGTLFMYVQTSSGKLVYYMHSITLIKMTIYFKYNCILQMLLHAVCTLQVYSAADAGIVLNITCSHARPFEWAWERG